MSDILDVLRNVRLVEPRQQEVVLRINENQIDSLQTFPLYCGMTYALIAEADWVYIPTLIIKNGEWRKTPLEGYTLEQLKEPVALPLTEFHDNTAQLLPLAKLELEVLAHFMQQHARCQIELTVHANGVDDKAAYALSLQRATAIRNYIASFGITADRIHLSAYGNVAFHQGQSPDPVAVRFF
jgi:outer membrane protein OmpA-like peptidoglycan-associated protein